MYHLSQARSSPTRLGSKHPLPCSVNCQAMLFSILIFLSSWQQGSLLNPQTRNNRLFADAEKEETHFPLTTKLSNGRTMPLIGVGVGNLAHDRIHPIITHALESGMDIRLVDTAHASRNEKIVSDAIAAGLNREQGSVHNTSSGNGEDVVHVVTKVWYTHLGYARTKLAVKEILSELQKTHSKLGNRLRVHILLHWPRCDESISWMDCEGDETNLPDHVKAAGPPPHLDKENAWKESWKALEDLYSEDSSLLASIGVSNFGESDMRELISLCRVKPHLYQGNLWSLLFDPYLINILRENGVIFQAYNVMNGVLKRRNDAPNAYREMEILGRELGETKKLPAISASTLILAWLVQDNISIIPRSSSFEHQMENSPHSIREVPALTSDQQHRIESSVKALMTGEDLGSGKQSVQATFLNTLTDSPISIFWSHLETGEEIPVHPDDEEIHPGASFALGTHPGHVFVVYDSEKTFRKEYRVGANYGEHELFSVEL